jgi:anti-sigma B factor antagonist
MELRTRLESLGDGTRLVAVAGEIDLHTAARFEQELQAAIQQPFERLLVDLTDCDYLDSTALHVLVRAYRSLDGKADRLSFIVPSANLRRLFELTGLDATLHVHADRESALKGESRSAVGSRPASR